jgi:hypothetical protein
MKNYNNKEQDVKQNVESAPVKEPETVADTKVESEAKAETETSAPAATESESESDEKKDEPVVAPVAEKAAEPTPAPTPAPAEPQKKGKSNLPLIFLVVLLIGVIAAMAVALMKKNETAETTSDEPLPTFESSYPQGGIGLEIDDNAGDYVAPTQDASADKGVAIPGWGSLKFKAGELEQAVDFYNPDDNMDEYYLTFEIRLTDESQEDGYEVIYTSGLIEPSKHVQKITLSHALEAGTYDSIIHVQPYRMDEARTATNNADMATQLIVQ